MSFEIGGTVGDYRITGVLGRGGMGKVFRVRNLISDREEAMKVVLPSGAADAALEDRFLREIKVQASLDHPHIAALHTALRTPDGIVMIMELVEGESLAERLRRGPLPSGEAIGCVSQVLAALAFAHARGIVHRDVKPANIIATSGGNVKLTDFGIARTATERGLTSPGVALGSIDYMPPEQIRAGTVDARSDLYSLGAAFYEMVTGRRPFEGENEYAVMNAHLERAPVPPAALVPGLPVQVSGIILRALEKDPADRFQNAAEFQAALDALGNLAPGTAPPPAGIGPADAARVEAALLAALGPVARTLVAREASRHAGLPGLCGALAEHIPDPRERAAFLRAAGVRSSTGSAPVLTGAAVTWDPAVLATAQRQLAAYLGPIARVVVERAARRATTPAELYAALAAEIPSESDRRVFLASAPR